MNTNPARASSNTFAELVAGQKLNVRTRLPRNVISLGFVGCLIVAATGAGLGASSCTCSGSVFAGCGTGAGGGVSGGFSTLLIVGFSAKRVRFESKF